jgi:hypothetical protein
LIRVGRFARCAGLIAMMTAFGAAAHGGQIQWCSGTAEFVDKSPDGLRAALAPFSARSGAQHVVLRFNRPMTEATRSALHDAGVEVQAYLSDQAFLAKVDGARLDAAVIAAEPALKDVRPIEPVWKLHPLLAEGIVPEYAVVEATKDASKPEENVVGAYVLFHADVPLLSKGVDAVLQRRGVVRDTLESINGLVIELPQGEIEMLAADDAVMWIEPPLPRFSEMNNSNRVRVGGHRAAAAIRADGGGGERARL